MSFGGAFLDANGVSLHYELASGSGHSVVLLHELGGTLHSWDAVAPRLAERFRVLRYDQRGAGLSEKVRQEFTNDMLVADFEALATAVNLPPPYHFVTVAAAATQALRFLEKHPGRVGALVLCNPAPGVDASRAAVLDERAALAAREGMRASLPTTLALSYPPSLGERNAYEAYLGRYLANDPVCFGFAFALWRAPTCRPCCRKSAVRPWSWPAATTRCDRMPARPRLPTRFPARGSN